MIRGLVLVIVTSIVTLIGPAAEAEGCTLGASGDSVNGGITVHDADCTPVTVTDGSGGGGGGADPIRDSDLDAVCVSTAISMDIDPFTFCQPPPGQAEDAVSPGLVAQALRFVPLPPPVIHVEPANGRTLVNFDTNFFTETVPFDRTITLLGQQVDLHIVPGQFGWRFGDGETMTTAKPGAPYPQLDVTHSYLTKGHVAPSVDTTYTATFRVKGGPWQDVPGSVTVAGAPVDLEVLTATPTLVGY